MNDLILRNSQKIGYLAKKLAEMVGVSEKTVQSWEYGKTIPISKHVLLRSLLLDQKPETQYVGNVNERTGMGKRVPFYDDISTIGGMNQCGANLDALSQPTDYIDTGDWFRDATAALRHCGESMLEYPPGCIFALKDVSDLVIRKRNSYG